VERVARERSTAIKAAAAGRRLIAPKRRTSRL
jgi:hypothetical protein